MHLHRSYSRPSEIQKSRAWAPAFRYLRVVENGEPADPGIFKTS
jgi:hypothetical protein